MFNKASKSTSDKALSPNPTVKRFSPFDFMFYCDRFSCLSCYFLSGPVPEIQPLNESLVDATIRVYSTITSQLLPTPAKSHYTFNLRDLSKVFQGILMAEACMIEVVRSDRIKLIWNNHISIMKLWVWESPQYTQIRFSHFIHKVLTMCATVELPKFNIKAFRSFQCKWCTVWLRSAVPDNGCYRYFWVPRIVMSEEVWNEVKRLKVFLYISKSPM